MGRQGKDSVVEVSRVVAVAHGNFKSRKRAALNRDFEKHFEDECKKLRAPAVTLQFPGRQGQVSRKKAVASGQHRPSEVLSEGGQKVIVLADFLAEAARPSDL